MTHGIRKEHVAFRRDPTPRIVAIELGETGTVKVYRREADGSTVADVEPFHPFVWCDSDVADLGIDAEKLAERSQYGWLIRVDSWKELIALRNGLKKAGRSFFALAIRCSIISPRPVARLFKELPFEELRRLQIEVLSADGIADAGTGITDPGSGDHIMSIALSDNSGWEELIIVDPKNVEESEHAAIKRLTRSSRSGIRMSSKATTCSVSIFPISSRGAKRRRRNSTGDVAADFCVRGRRDSRSRRRRSITQSSQSMDATSSTHFCSRNFTMSACAHFLVSSGPMWRGISDFATVTRFPRLPARNCSARTWTMRKNFGSRALCACARNAGRCLIC